MLTILAVSKLGGDLCVAGVNDRNVWIRPTVVAGNGWRQFYKSDVFDVNGAPVISLSNQVTIRLQEAIPQIQTPHVEDWQYDRSFRPILINSLVNNTRLSFLHRFSEPSLASLTENPNRSLILIEPVEILLADFANVSYRGKYQPLIKYSFNNETISHKVTCIYWRALGRVLMQKYRRSDFTGEMLKAILGYSRLFLCMGLSRKYQGAYWPFIVGVHLVPSYSIKIDYEDI